MNFKNIRVIIFGIIVIGSYIFMLLQPCHADIIGNGEVRLALSDISATTDWQGREKSSTIYGIVADYTAKQQAGRYERTFISEIAYSTQETQGKKSITDDNVKLRLDSTHNIVGNVKGVTSIKYLGHVDADDYIVYLKAGLSKTEGMELRRSATSTTPIKLLYTAKASVSYRTGDNSRFGVLTELDAMAMRGAWAVRVKDADLFLSGLDNNSFEIPVMIEYNANKWVFVNYTAIIRGTSHGAGCLRTLRTGIKLGF